MKLIYSWVDAHQAITEKLPAYRGNQNELINILQQAGVDRFDDETSPGQKTSLTEIDPFTFFSYIYKHGPLRNKRILNSVCRLMHIDIPVKDICGVPSVFATNVWFFPYAYERTHNEINRLWDFFDNLISNTISNADFQNILSIRSIGKSKLLDGMFRITPYNFLCFNSLVSDYLISKGIDPVFNSFSELRELQVRIQNELNIDFIKLSYDAYIQSTYSQHQPTYFRIGCRNGENGNSLLPVMIQNNIASIGWHEIGDLEDIAPLNRANFQRALQTNGFYRGDNRTASRKAGEIFTFYNGILPYDYVLIADGMTIKAIGRVISDNYLYEDSFDFPHCRNVEWIKTDIDDLDIDEGLRTSVWQYEYPESKRKIESYLGINPSVENRATETQAPSSSSALPEFPLNVIFYGPPGTGKTYRTIDKAVEIINGTSGNHLQNKEEFDKLKEDGRIAFVTFHQSYTYEDFMTGIKPDMANTNNQLSFVKHKGIFYSIVEKARSAYDSSLEKNEAKRYVLIIDEINRANISKVFGELITLLEDDKRIGGDNELKVKLSSGEDFSVPPNLYIIGTMNTADKSIALIDIALRRRFEFIGMYPDVNTLVGRYNERISFLETINRNIYEKRKNADYLIGHAYLLKEIPLDEIIKKKIIPLLLEYFSGRIDDVRSIFNKSGYAVQYDATTYEWRVDLNRIADEIPDNL